MSEQPKLVNPGVADVSEDDEYDAILSTEEKETEKPSYVTRAVAARRAAGLDGESLPRTARGVEARRVDITEIDDCIYIDDEDVNSFISTDINEITIKKFLQREMDFYKKAFPQDILIRKSSR